MGLFGGEADVGRFGSFVGAGLYEAGGVEGSADGGDGDCEALVVLQVPGDGVGAGVAVEGVAGD